MIVDLGRFAPERADSSHASAPAPVPKLWLLAAAGAIVLAVGLIFGQTIHHQFLNYDDDTFVYNNPYVTAGITLSGIRWALVDGPFHEWYPLASISHMLDCQLLGLNPAGHHLHNLLLHAASSVLLLLVLARTTRDFWPSAWAAGVFAVHPLHVSSVAWISERRELLGGLFFMLTLLAYGRYCRRPSLARYLTVFAALTLGLMSKATLVTLPFVLLLLDYWPLCRFRADDVSTTEPATQSISWFARLPLAQRLILEKLPMLVLVVLDGAMVLWTHQDNPVVDSVDPLPITARVANALVSYAAYIGQSFWPVNLSPYYPHPGSTLPLAGVLGALALLIALTLVAVLCRRRMAFLPVGWLWFLGMLVPVLGLVGWFLQGRADNYTYLSQIGLSIAVAWTTWSGYQRWQSDGAMRWRGWALVLVSGATLVALAGVSWRQTAYWRDTEAVWTRALDCTRSNTMAHYCLGCVYQSQDRRDEAIRQFQLALAMRSTSRFITAETHGSLAGCLAGAGRPREALEHLQEAVRAYPEGFRAQFRLADALTRLGRYEEAIGRWSEVVRLSPQAVDARMGLAEALLASGRTADVDEAILQMVRAAQLDSQNANTRFRLGQALIGRGQTEEGVLQLLAARQAARCQNNRALAEVIDAQLRDLRQATADRRSASESTSE